MAESSTPRSALATIVGWLIVAVIGWFVLSSVLGAVFWVARGFLWVLILGGLVWAYLALKAPSDD
jgi:hypothetical protein